MSKIADLDSLIRLDVKYNKTPDTPSLRYNGAGVTIFLWDDLQDFRNFQSVFMDTDIQSHYMSGFHNARTVDSFIPWYNLADVQGASYPGYCLANPEDVNEIDCDDHAIGTPLPLAGKTAMVSLQALQELDLYYENQGIFQRRLIDVWPSLYSASKLQCYAWFNELDMITTYDPKDMIFLLDRGIDPTLMTPRTKGQFEVYEM